MLVPSDLSTPKSTKNRHKCSNTYIVSDRRGVYAIDFLCHHKVANVVDILRSSVVVVVTSLAMGTEAVRVVNAQVHALTQTYMGTAAS